MKDELKETQGFFEVLSNEIHRFIAQNVPDALVLTAQIAAKLLFFVVIIVVLNFIYETLFKAIHSAFYRKFKKTPVIQSLYESKVLNSVANFMALGFGQQLIEPIMGRHPNSHTLLERTFTVLMIIAGYVMYKRALHSIERFYVLRQDFYRITAIRAITSTLLIIGGLIFVFLGISAIFGVSTTSIWTSLTAMTAVIILIFRDTILGFVTGIHVSLSRNVKVGDWIGIPKYNIEGTIADINLLTTKIHNFDKTVSTIPTYDLLSTEIKNLQVMAEGNRRRIKKSIYFNINSFKFIDRDFFDQLKKINLIEDYLSEREAEIFPQSQHMPTADLLINGRQLTNIGVFRKYVHQYLKQNPQIDQNEIVLVRQLDITPQGMPLELYCFANQAALADFEDIQANIFDHLLASAKVFDLDIMQTKV